MALAVTTRCCIVGGGPAGMMLGFLLARAGIAVTLLEKHEDFLRDFRGDTIHPSTLEVMHELGLLDEFLALPHHEAPVFQATIGGTTVQVADFRHLPTRCRFIAFMPQWDFLSFLARHGARHPGFDLRMRTEATGLIEEEGRVVGVRVAGPEGEIRAHLVIGADGRHSTVREASGLAVDDLGAPMDVLWFRLPRQAGDPEATAGRFEAGAILIAINHGAHWQCGFVIPKGSLAALRERGLDAFRAKVALLAPFAADRLATIGSWDEVKLLTVGVARMPRWHRPGLLCLGDAAHTMSPIGGVGINLAIQDAVAAANILAAPLREGRVEAAHLEAVERRRALPARLTQRVQLMAQKRVVARLLAERGTVRPPLPTRLLGRFPVLQRIPGRLIGMGFRPEHVRDG